MTGGGLKREMSMSFELIIEEDQGRIRGLFKRVLNLG